MSRPRSRPLYIVSDIAGRTGGTARLGHVAHVAEEASGAETIAASDTPGGKGKRPIA